MDISSWKTIPVMACKKKNSVVHTPDFVSDAYMHQLRCSNRTKRIYQAEPYVEVYQFRENLYSLYTENCDAGGAVYMHLIVGPRRALLIDTAYGLGDLQTLVNGLAGGKPVLVANTHHHCDHAYGNCRFPQVYCHEYDVPYLQAQDSHIWDYLFDEDGNNKWLDFDRSDLPVFHPYGIVPIQDGHIFDLGDGYEVETVWLGGHTPGHCGFLDRKNRIFFCGDDITSSGCGAGMGPNPDDTDPHALCYMNLAFFRDRLASIAARINEFDFLFPQHGPLELGSGLVPIVLDTCDTILQRPDQYDFITSFPGLKGEPPVKRLNKYIPGLGVMCYRESGVRPLAP